jgi:hypothetical protein
MAVDHLVGPVLCRKNTYFLFFFLQGLSFGALPLRLRLRCFAYQAMLATTFCNLALILGCTHMIC